MTKNLTGSKRIIYDSCVDLYNAVQKWRSLTADCLSTIVNIWMVKQEEINKLELKIENELLSKFNQDIYIQLEKLSSILLSKIESLENVLQKLESTVTKVKAVSELSDLHQSNNNDFSSIMDCIPFKTWPLSKFSAVTEEIVSMFKEEFNVKSIICKEICHISDKSIFLFYEACWKYEPNIDKCKLNIFLNGIIFELDLILEIS